MSCGGSSSTEKTEKCGRNRTSHMKDADAGNSIRGVPQLNYLLNITVEFT